MRKIQISDHFRCSEILLFALPSIGMQLVDNTYQVVDGYFISNYIGSSAFAAENLIFPPLAVVAGVGMMFGTGGAALISHSLGEGETEKANTQLTRTVGVLAVTGILLSVLLFLFFPWIIRLVGVPAEVVPMCMQYGRILAVCMPFLILNGAFHPLLITANQPGLGLLVSIINAAVNILLDWVAVGILRLGLTGAALATGLAWVCSATIPLFYFFNKRHSMHFRSFKWNSRELGQTCYNGSSEMANVISFALIAMLFNSQLLRFSGEAGVSAYAVCSYVKGIFTSVFFGIGMSITPVVGYHLGQKNLSEVRNVFRNGTLINAVLGIAMMLISFLAARPIARFFVGYDMSLTDLSVEALRFISFSYLLGGITTFASSFFTGLGDGGKSLAIATSKSFIFPLIFVFLLPLLFGLKGIWLVTPVAEVITLLLAVFFFKQIQRKGIL